MDTWEDELASAGRTLELVDRPELVEVRRWAGRALDELADPTREELQDVLLVVNELTANAYEHGRSPVRLRLSRLGDVPCLIRIEVDDSSPLPPLLGRSTLRGTRGRGMVLVDELAKDWGVLRVDGGKTVWATVPCDPR